MQPAHWPLGGVTAVERECKLKTEAEFNAALKKFKGQDDELTGKP